MQRIIAVQAYQSARWTMADEIVCMAVAGSIATAVSSVAFKIGTRTAGGRFKNYLTLLEHWFMAEVFESSAGMTLDKANEINPIERVG